MGCNGRDFKKTDLVKDKDVLGHLNTLKQEKEKADNKDKSASAKANQADVGEVIIDDCDEDVANKSAEIQVALEAPNLSESSSDEATNDNNQAQTAAAATSQNTICNVTLPTSPGKNVDSSASGGQSPRKKRQERLSYSDLEESSDSEVEAATSSRPKSSKRSRRPSSKYDNSYALSEDDSDDAESDRRRKKGKGRSPKKLKIVGKKVTETWCIEKSASKGKRRRRRKSETSEDEDDDDKDSDESSEDVPRSKGKSSKGRPPKNSHLARGRPKRAKQVSYKEFDEEY